MDSPKTEYPPNHKVGMRVTQGGSCCANCKFWDGEDCENKYFRQWNNRSGKIGAPPDSYCCDFWESSKKQA